MPSCGWKDRIGSLTLTFSQPTAQHCDGLFAKRGAPAFASFAQALHVRTGAQGDVLTAQAGEFCRAQSGLHGQQQQGSIASSAPGVEVRRGEQSFNFDRREEADRSTHVAFTLHGEYALRQSVVFRRMQRNVAEERMDGSQTHVAATGAILPILFKVIEKGAEEWSIQIRHDQL